MALGSKVQHYRRKAGLTLEQLSGLSGVDVGTISALELRDSTRSKYALQLAAAFGMTVEMLQSDAEHDVVALMAGAGRPRSPSEASNVEPASGSRGDVPLISWVAASDWCEAGDPYPPGVAEEWLPCPARHSKGTFALRVRGDSMTAPHGNTRTYPEGCVIFVDPERRSPANGDRIIACLEGAHEVTFKVYKNEDGRQWLAPLNPSHEPIRDPFRVLGTIIGKWEAE